MKKHIASYMMPVFAQYFVLKLYSTSTTQTSSGISTRSNVNPYTGTTGSCAHDIQPIPTTTDQVPQSIQRAETASTISIEMATKLIFQKKSFFKSNPI